MTIFVYQDMILDNEEPLSPERLKVILERDQPEKVVFDGPEFTQFAADAARVVMAYNAKHGNLPGTGITMEARSDAMLHGLDELVTGGLQKVRVS